MQDQDPNKPQDDEFFEDEFEDFGDFGNNESAQDGSFETYDEYGDTDQGAEYEELSDDGWDDQAGGEETAGAYTGKSGGGLLSKFSFNTIVIAGAVIVGLGVLVYQVVMAPAPNAGQNRFQSALNFEGSRDGVVMDRPEEESNAANDMPQNADGDDAGFMNDPGVLGNLSEEANNSGLPMPAPISNDMDEQGMDQQPSSETITPMPEDVGISFNEAEPVPRGPAAEGNGMPEDAVPEETAAPSPALDIIRKAQNQQAVSQPAAEPQEMMEEPAEPQNEDVAQDMPAPEPVREEPAVTEEQIVEEAQPAPSVTASNAVASDAVLKKLDELSNRLGVMEQQIVQIRESGQTDVENLEKEIARIKGSVGETTRAVKPAETEPAPKAAVAKKASEPKKQPVASKSAAKSGPVSWELRAAQPGRAWVSRRGEREMQSIEPGSSLAGIGQVLRIEYANGRWTVVGTQGNINQ